MKEFAAVAAALALAGCGSTQTVTQTRTTGAVRQTVTATTTPAHHASAQPTCASGNYFKDGECAPKAATDVAACPSSAAYRQGACNPIINACVMSDGFYQNTANDGAGGCVYSYTAQGDGSTLRFHVIGPPQAHLLHSGLAECAFVLTAPASIGRPTSGLTGRRQRTAARRTPEPEHNRLVGA